MILSTLSFLKFNTMKKTVIIQFEAEGFHNYPNPPKEVEFLSYNHRHTFVFKCGYEVEHLNREKEIFICRDIVKKYLFEQFGNPCQFKNMSCEMIAEGMLNKYKNDGMSWCEVWEEETGGARVEI